MMYPEAYIQYLVHFHGDRDYFECHEILEEHWKKDARGQRAQKWVGLIQLAVSFYHYRRGNWQGAARMMRNAISILEREEHDIAQLGLDVATLLPLLRLRLADIQQQLPYTSIVLPLADEQLKLLCMRICEEAGSKFGSASDMTNMNLINRHTLRDRSDVIAERKQQLQKRKQR